MKSIQRISIALAAAAGLFLTSCEKVIDVDLNTPYCISVDDRALTPAPFPDWESAGFVRGVVRSRSDCITPQD